MFENLVITTCVCFDLHHFYYIWQQFNCSTANKKLFIKILKNLEKELINNAGDHNIISIMSNRYKTRREDCSRRKNIKNEKSVCLFGDHLFSIIEKFVRRF